MLRPLSLSILALLFALPAAAQTTDSFAIEMFPGGHFFIQSHQSEFLTALARDLEMIKT